MSFAPGDKIFAKVKGHPHWPCRINVLPPDVRIPKGKYPIFFYGTHEVYFLASKDIFPYEKYKHKYAINRNKPAFQAGLSEIELDPDILLYGKDPNAESFLSRFYQFAHSGAIIESHVVKRPTVSSPPAITTPPAKRAHIQSNADGSGESLSAVPAPSQPPKTTPSSVNKLAKNETPKKRPPKPSTTPTSRSQRLSKPRDGKPILPEPAPEKTMVVAPVAAVECTPPAPTVPTPPDRPIRSRRVSALRLRIKTDADGVKCSLASGASSLSSLSPSTPGSVGAVENMQLPDGDIPFSTDSLKITIRPQPPISSSRLSPNDHVDNETTTATTITTTPPTTAAKPSPTTSPIFPVTTMPSVSIATITPTPPHPPLSVHTINKVQMKKSTAVVTPLRRGKTISLTTDELSDLSSSTSDEEEKNPKFEQKPVVQLSTKRVRKVPSRFLDSDDETTVVLPAKSKAITREERSLPVSTAVSSDGGNSSTVSPRISNDWPAKSTPNAVSVTTSVTTPHISPLPIITRPPTDPSPSETQPSPSPIRPSVVDTSTKPFVESTNLHEQEQKLKELDTEARLLLIDRSIKSSLVRDHEDIRTCVDRLELLDGIPISLPILAKCWTLVETIGKCRRYKRSMEVKIAAQKIFNKFLHLYATADKCDVDLATAELYRHQQRYVKQTSTTINRESGTTLTPSYKGPKNLTDLFQMSNANPADRRPVNKVTADPSQPSTPSVSLYTPQSLVTPPATFNEHPPLVSEIPILSLKDIPLPQEVFRKSAHVTTYQPSSNRTPSHFSEANNSVVAHINPEDEFEVLDEYDAMTEPSKVAIPPSFEATAPVLQATKDYVPTSVVETQIIPYDMVPPHLLPPPGGTLPPAYCSETAMYPIIPVHYPFATPYPPLLHQPTLPHPVSYPSGMTLHHPYVMDPTQGLPQTYVPPPMHTAVETAPPPHLQRDEFDNSGKLRDTQPPTVNSNSVQRPNFPEKYHRSRSPSSSLHHRRRQRMDSSDGRHSRNRNARSPHRARSPHALPHPLEHYQRCLSSALYTDDLPTSEGESTNYHPSKHSHGSSKNSYNMHRNIDHRALGHHRRRSGPTSSKGSEDLDARIARIIGTTKTTPASTVQQNNIDGPKRSHPLGSPPPPPPPPTTSQRILFTHRPQNMSDGSRNPHLSGSSSNTPESPVPRRTVPTEIQENTASTTVDTTEPVSTVSMKESVDLVSISRSALPETSLTPAVAATATTVIMIADETDKDLYSLLGV